MKSNNISYRYDTEKMRFLMEAEKIDNPRKVLDFLLDKYWWEKKFGVNPVLEAQKTTVKDLTNNPPKTNYTVGVPKINQFDAYEAEIRGCKNIPQIKNTISALEKDNMLSPIEKKRLRELAVHLSQNMYNE